MFVYCKKVKKVSRNSKIDILGARNKSSDLIATKVAHLLLRKEKGRNRCRDRGKETALEISNNLEFCILIPCEREVRFMLSPLTCRIANLKKPLLCSKFGRVKLVPFNGNILKYCKGRYEQLNTVLRRVMSGNRQGEGDWDMRLEIL